MDAQNLACLPLAMTYTPWQSWEGTFAPCEALRLGTAFSRLNLPFLGEEGCA